MAESVSRYPPHVHPVLAALFDMLPAPDAVWPIEERDRWLDCVDRAFHMLYLPHEGEKAEAVRITRLTDHFPKAPRT